MPWMKCYWFARVSASAQPGNGIEQCQAQRPSWGQGIGTERCRKKRVGPKEKALNGRRTVTALSSPATAKTRRVERSHMAACLRSATANISRSRCVKRRVRYACLGSAAACLRAKTPLVGDRREKAIVGEILKIQTRASIGHRCMPMRRKQSSRTAPVSKCCREDKRIVQAAHAIFRP